jgi:two-component system response regulator FixJ
MPNEAMVHVIDDDEAVRDAIAFLLSSAGFAARTYDSAAAFLARSADVEPGCVITDVRMPGMTGLELADRLRALEIDLPVIVITGHGDIPLAVKAMKGGVVDFIEKPFEDERLLEALKTALASGEDRKTRSGERALVRQRLALLSARERQVLDGVVGGLANKMIARELDISPRTVEVYRANLMTKMQAASLSELVRMTLLADAER